MFTTTEKASNSFYKNFGFSIVLKKPLVIFLKVRTFVEALNWLKTLVNRSDNFLEVM